MNYLVKEYCPFIKLTSALYLTSVIELTIELEIAQDVLRFANEQEQTNEIIAIYSEQVEKEIGSFLVDLKINWLGKDITCSLNGSMILAGIFTKPELFSDFTKHLNQYGLFQISSPVVDSYISHYFQLNEEGYNLETFTNENLKE